MNEAVISAASRLAVSLEPVTAAARVAQPGWAARRVAERLEVLKNLRVRIARDSLQVADTTALLRGRPQTESLTAEVLPLLEACRFLEKNAARILTPQRLSSWSRPLWLAGVKTELHREPLGVVLIIGPGNYPLLLPGVQLLQAVVAGNAVLVKPAPGCRGPMERLLEMLLLSGLDPGLVTLLPDTIEAAEAALASDINKVLFTGSAATGEKILAQLAPLLLPATMELSGCDSVLIRADADLDLAVRALTFGLRLNAGETCMGPRRVFVARSRAADLDRRLLRASVKFKRAQLDPNVVVRLLPVLREALSKGADLISGSIDPGGFIEGPVIVTGVSPSLRLLHEELFAPLLLIVTVADDDEAILHANDSRYALGSSIFTRDETAGGQLAKRLNAGVVSVNDLIVPTGDPRVPFGGRKRSGFGVTRGVEGLLELTVTKVVTVSRSRFRPAFDESKPGDEELFSSYLRLVHGLGWRCRARALFQLLRRLAGRGRSELKL